MKIKIKNKKSRKSFFVSEIKVSDLVALNYLY